MQHWNWIRHTSNARCSAMLYYAEQKSVFHSTLLMHGGHFDYWNQPLNMRMRFGYLYCHEAGLRCYLVIHIENLLHQLPLFYSQLWLLSGLYLGCSQQRFVVLYVLGYGTTVLVSHNFWCVELNTYLFGFGCSRNIQDIRQLPPCCYHHRFRKCNGHQVSVAVNHCFRQKAAQNR
jgi:hypothetical protein